MQRPLSLANPYTWVLFTCVIFFASTLRAESEVPVVQTITAPPVAAMKAWVDPETGVLRGRTEGEIAAETPYNADEEARHKRAVVPDIQLMDSAVILPNGTKVMTAPQSFWHQIDVVVTEDGAQFSEQQGGAEHKGDAQ